jgi:hypothetical protein
LQTDGDAQVGVRPLVFFDVVANKLTGVKAIDVDRFVDAEIERGLFGFVLIAKQVKIALFKKPAVLLPIRGVVDALQQVVP